MKYHYVNDPFVKGKSEFLKKLKIPKQNREAKLVYFYIRACRFAFKVLLLTATPVLNRPYDMISLISMIDGTENIDINQFYEHVFVSVDGPDKYKEFLKGDKFDEYFGCKVSFYKREDDSEDFPKRNNFKVELELADNLLDAYNQLEEYANEGGNEDFQDIIEMINGPHFYNDLRIATNNLGGENNPKVRWITDKLEKREGKSVVYSNYKYSKTKKTSVNHVVDFCKEHKIKYSIIDGDVTKQKRTQIVKDYNDNKIQVLFITKAGGEGLDLKQTRNIIITEPYWNRSLIEQVIGRGIRYKSHSTLPASQRYVNVYELLLIKPQKPEGVQDFLPETVDSMLYDFSNRKARSNQIFIDLLKSVAIENVICD